MATNSAQTPAPIAPADAHFDEKTGIYGFFRRNQKKLLYTVGLFVLLTFSVSGPMLASVDSLFARTAPMPTLEVGGVRAPMTPEDFNYGQRLARVASALGSVLPRLDSGEGGQSDLGDVYAMLRFVARTEGIDASMTEVDQAIKVRMEASKITSASQLAAQMGFASLAEFRDLMREGLRIGTLVRLQTLMLDTSDAEVLQKVIVDKEKVGFKVATFDEKALEATLKAAGPLSEEDLRKWIGEKTDVEKNQFQAFDTNRVELKIGAAMHDGFDASQWQDEALKDYQVGKEQIDKSYQMEKERWKQPDGTYKPVTDDAVQAELKKLLELDQVMTNLLGKLRESQNEAMQTANEDLRRTTDAQTTAANTLTQANEAVSAATKKLEEKPDDEALKAELTRAQEELRLAKEVPPAMDAAKTAAEEAVKAARIAFDFPAAFTKLTAGKTGFVQKSTTGKRNGESLKDLEAGDIGLGQWPESNYATFLHNNGDLAYKPGRTTKATILYQISDIEVRPLKPWETLKPLAEGAYYTEQAKKAADANKKLMDDALLRLAKAKMPDQVAEIEGKRAATLTTKVEEWEKQLRAGLEKADKKIVEVAADTQAGIAWARKRASVQEQLDKKADKEKALAEEVGKQIEADVRTAVKKVFVDVLAEAAAEASFTVRDIGPFSRELAQRPRFDKRFDETVVFVYSNHAEMKAGEATDIVDDTTNRRRHVICCTEVKPLEPSDVERREFELLRKGYYFDSYASLQAQMSYVQAFTKKAIETRYHFQNAVGEQVVDKPPADPK